MSNNCSIKLTVDKLPKIINKVEYFLFRAMEQKGMNFYKISTQPKTTESIEVINKIKSKEYTKEQLESLVGKKFTNVLLTAANLENTDRIGTEVYRIAQMVHLFDTIKNSLLPEYIADYIESSKISEEEGELAQAGDYAMFAANLENLVSQWSQIAPNFLTYSEIFNVKTKFNLDEDGLVDINDVADDEKKMLNKMVFDKPSNEVDPLDDIDKAVELFIRSIPIEDENDDYGFTVSVNYPTFVRQMFTDLENSIGMTDLISKLEKNKEKVPEYQYILDKIKYEKGLTREQSQFRINFRNSFAKAFLPIYITSIEKQSDGKNVFKVTEATSGKTSLYERIISSNFALRGMPVRTSPNSQETINLGHEEDGVWILDRTDVPKIEKYFNEIPAGDEKFRNIEFLKGVGFEFSDATVNMFTKSGYLNGRARFIKEHLLALLSSDPDTKIPYKPFIINPIKDLKKDLYHPQGKKDNNGKTIIISRGQNNNVDEIIAEELKNNVNYNIEKSVITAEGTRQHSIQLHNNFTILNRYLSEPEVYNLLTKRMEPVTLQDIIAAEPAMFWLDPEKNPGIRKSLLLNSLFFFDPLDKENYGKRRRVERKTIDKKTTYRFSSTSGEYVKISIINTGGLQLKFLSDFDKEGASSTSLNELDKLLQDLHGFMANKKGYNSVLRLGDKSTDLGIGLNYVLDVTTGQPALDDSNFNTPTPTNKPLASVIADSNIRNMIMTNVFMDNVTNALQDFSEMKYLGQKGFFKDLSVASDNILNTWGFFDGVLKSSTKAKLNKAIAEEAMLSNGSIDTVANILNENKEIIEKDIVDYFAGTDKTIGVAKSFFNKINDARVKLGLTSVNLIGKSDLEAQVNSYVLNSFITDIEQMKVFFGDAIYFKNFHKRASKDSATGIFAMVDADILEELNDDGNAQGYGANTNLSAKKLIDRVYKQQLAELEKSDRNAVEKKQLRDEFKNQRDAALQRQVVTQSYKSGVIKDVNFKSTYASSIIDNVALLTELNYVSPQMQELFKDSLDTVIRDKYKGTEADGQGKCTFDFYRTMSYLTSKWSDEQEVVYRKIVDYNHYDELADEETDPTKKIEYIQLRDAVGYDPTESVYFPPKKFQYDGPQNYTRTIDGNEYVAMVPIFDKFSLQPLIPTVIKGTSDEHLAKRMEYNGVGYVKFESGTKVESPKVKDDFYEDFNPEKPNERKIRPFQPTDRFKSEQELFFNNFKEQVAIDAEIHDSAIFGSQIRKLILMNLERPEFTAMKDNYIKYLAELAEIEKVAVYNEMGITRENGKLKVKNLGKIVEYFFKEIAKKNQDTNVKKALNYDEKTGKFDIPLDAAVQAQVLEGIIISAINNRVVRYKTNGSMLTQIAVTGSEKVNKFNKEQSNQAIETYGNDDLGYYEIVPNKNGERDAFGNLIPTVTKMGVKIALTGQWLGLLNLDHPDRSKIGSIERLNEALKDEEWMARHEKKITMIAYRIPTQGRNFLDVMKIQQFLPAAVGDAIVMPREVVIKSGSDFDIDKMFVFYPNLTEKGNYQDAAYTQADLQNPAKYNEIKGSIQNKLYETMQDIILHPANYIELVTPSDNYHIMPILDSIFEKLGLKTEGEDRKKTDYKNTEILERENNINKFLSLLKGKSDLGIAAVSNTFNVMFQLANAEANPDFFGAAANKGTSIKTFFNSDFVEKSNGRIIGVDFSSIFDEDGVLKSEFFSEFINAFVDVANDDYVFAANVVTELSPVMFYMKYAGMSSKKILNFVNQPAIRLYTKNLAMFQNKFIKLNGIGENTSARRLAMALTLRELGYSDGKGRQWSRNTMEEYLGSNQGAFGILNFDQFYTDDMLSKGIRKDELGINTLSDKGKLVQVSMLLELENLKLQSNSVTEAQKFLNFDTNPFSSTFDIYSRDRDYEKALEGSNILSPATIANIKLNSIISPLDMSDDIKSILSSLFPVRNDERFNKFVFEKANELKDTYENKSIISQDDVLRFARTAKNDYLNYILQNFIGLSKEGMEFFHSTFETKKDFNDYLAELVQTSKLPNLFQTIKSLPYYEALAKKYPVIRNIVVERGQNNRNLVSFKIVENSSNAVEKESVIRQFEELSSLEDPEYKIVRTFFRDLALYSIFQSGMNTSDISFTSSTPISIVNKLYGDAVKEYSKINDSEKDIEFKNFNKLFVRNNPGFYGNLSSATITQEISSRGKWYSNDVNIGWETKEKPVPQQLIPVIKNVIVNPKNGVKVISQADVDAYHAYLQKSNDKAPKEFFTSNTAFKEFYNPSTGKREKAPQDSKWLLQDNGLYNLVSINRETGGELYIEDVDLRTGIKIVEPSTQPSSNVETARTIYDKLGNKTQSENIILPKDVDPEADNIGMTYTTAIDFWRKIVPEAMDLYNKTKPLIVAFRGNSKKTFLQNYNSGTHTIGNPFNWQVETGTRNEQGIKSTKRFIHWMMTGDNMGIATATPEYRQAIINDIKSGKIKNSPILYYEEKNYATHATALDYLINKYDWSASPTQPSTSVEPKKPFERTFVPPTRDAEGNVISREGTVENSISNWMKQNPVNPLTDSIQTLADRYNKEKLSTETIEEFLKRLSCK